MLEFPFSILRSYLSGKREKRKKALNYYKKEKTSKKEE